MKWDGFTMNQNLNLEYHQALKASTQPEILTALLSGGVVTTSRQRGKTSALLQCAKTLNDNGENAIIVVHVPRFVEYVAALWQELYGRLPYPVIAVGDNDLIGKNGLILIDELLFSWYKGPFYAAIA